MFEPARCLTLAVYGTLLGMVMMTAMAPVAVSTYRPITPTIPAEEATAKRRQRVRPLCGCSPVARTTSSASEATRRARRPVLIDRISPAEMDTAEERSSCPDFGWLSTQPREPA